MNVFLGNNSSPHSSGPAGAVGQVSATVPSEVDVIANAVGGFCGFLGWAARYGHEMKEVAQATDPAFRAGGLDCEFFLSLSTALSASFNYGYGEREGLFFALEAEEFEWLPLLPISEVIVAVNHVYVLTRQLDLGDGDVIPALALEIQTDQQSLWHCCHQAEEAGFSCCDYDDAQGTWTEKFAPVRVPVRFWI